MKIDLHVHTCHSRRSAVWLLQKIGCPESFTDPLQCYRELKRLGMRMVTFTDHNSIEGCLAVAHLPDTFISEEITAYFPEDRCKVHVLAYDLTEDMHFAIQKKRENIYELVDFLREREIPHAIAHAFSAVNEKFTRRHFEKLLLLFNAFEINGDQLRAVNRRLRRTLGALTPGDIRSLSRRHGIAPHGDTPWRKNLVCGSDDHAGTRFADSFTQVENAATLDDFFTAVENGASTVHVASSTERSFARDIYSVMYRYAKNCFNLNRYSGADPLLSFCDATLRPRSPGKCGILSRIGYAIHALRQPRSSGAAVPPTGFIREQANLLLKRMPEWRRLLEHPGSCGDGANIWFEFASSVANLAVADMANTFMKRLRGGRYLDLFHLLGNTGSLSLLLSPYFVAYPFYAAERRLARQLAQPICPGGAVPAPRIACVTDMFHEDNGVMESLCRQLACAAGSRRFMRVVTVGEKEEPHPGIRNFLPAYTWELPKEGGLRLRFPPLLPLLDHISQGEYSCLQAASVGPTGLASLLIGRLLGIPVFAAYHPEYADYLRTLTEDPSLSEWAWKYMAWFFSRCDLVQAGSKPELEALAAHGVPRRILRLCPRDTDPAAAFDEQWRQALELIAGKRPSEGRRAAANRVAGEPFPQGAAAGMEFLFGKAAPADWLRQTVGAP